MSHPALPLGDAAEVGFDPERLGRIGPAMQAYVDDQRVPNLVTLIARRGRIVHLDARGTLSLATGKPATPESLFRMFSNTKPLAGLATCILYERGLLSPDDPVSRFLPEFGDSRVQISNAPGMTERARRGITVRDCLTNTTGILNPGTMPSYYREQYADVFARLYDGVDALKTLGWMRRDDDAPKPSRERVRALAELPLMAHPGEAFEYHVGYPVLTEVIATASGQPVDEFFQQNIFDPLGMDSTGFYVKEGLVERFGDCYIPRRSGGVVKLVVFDRGETSEKVTGSGEFCVGGSTGGIVTTVGDYARFGQMLLNGGELDGVRVLGRRTVDLMVGNHTGNMAIPITGPGFHWGLGVATYHGRDRPAPLIRSAGSYGWDGAAGTSYWADPSEELLGVCLTQVMQAGMMPNNDYQEAFQRLVYQALA
ncbi:MAG: beta-lactamase family protein [Gammaproteobacteria bacterium]|nr:beta-lactamase family protein [Gammaproteobacteria bacterium]